MFAQDKCHASLSPKSPTPYPQVNLTVKFERNYWKQTSAFFKLKHVIPLYEGQQSNTCVMNLITLCTLILQNISFNKTPYCNIWLKIDLKCTAPIITYNSSMFILNQRRTLWYIWSQLRMLIQFFCRIETLHLWVKFVKITKIFNRLSYSWNKATQIVQSLLDVQLYQRRQKNVSRWSMHWFSH